MQPIKEKVLGGAPVVASLVYCGSTIKVDTLAAKNAMAVNLNDRCVAAVNYCQLVI